MEESIVTIYKRFINELGAHSTIYIYPQYSSDLQKLLEFIEPYINEVDEIEKIYKKVNERQLKWEM